MDMIFGALWFLLESLFSGDNKREAVQGPLFTFTRPDTNSFEERFQLRKTPRYCPRCKREYFYVVLCTDCGIELVNK
jgi:hypothetical protein